MKCKIQSIRGEIKEVLCYKTEYKNVVIAKVDKNYYTITHWQTGMALSHDKFCTKGAAVMNLAETVKQIRSMGVHLKQFCRDRGIKQINF